MSVEDLFHHDDKYPITAEWLEKVGYDHYQPDEWSKTKSHGAIIRRRNSWEANLIDSAGNFVWLCYLNCRGDLRRLEAVLSVKRKSVAGE